MMTDQELFRRLDLLREECAPQAVPVSA
jgi:hypothetical protein